MENLMTIADVAEKMNLTEAAIRRYVLKKTIPYFKVGAAVRFLPSEVEEWFKANRKPPKAKAVKKQPQVEEDK